MSTCVSGSCTLQDRDPVCGVSPFVGADVFPITKKWKKCEWKIKETSGGPHFQVLFVSSTYLL